MRRVAAELGAGTMTLYRYVRNKADLVALMADAVMGELLVPEEELPADWRQALTLIAHRTRKVFARHTWAIDSLRGGGEGGPNGVLHFEQSMVAVAGTVSDGFDATEDAIDEPNSSFAFGLEQGAGPLGRLGPAAVPLLAAGPLDAPGVAFVVTGAGVFVITLGAVLGDNLDEPVDIPYDAEMIRRRLPDDLRGSTVQYLMESGAVPTGTDPETWEAMLADRAPCRALAGHRAVRRRNDLRRRDRRHRGEHAERRSYRQPGRPAG